MPEIIIAIVAALEWIGISAAVAAFLAPIILSIAASLVLGAISKMFAKGASGSSLTSQLASRTVTSRQAVAPWRVMYGKNRVGGIITFLHTTGANNEKLHIVITLAGHEVNAIPAMYFDGIVVPLDGSGNATGNFAGFVHAEFNLGTRTQAAFPGLLAAAPTFWDATHRQRGRAGAYVVLTWDVSKFPNGVPNITFDVQGRKVYDPRGSGASAADTFTRANGGPGANWVTEDGTFAITTNTIAAATNGGGGRAMMHWTGLTFANDQRSEIVINVLSSSGSRQLGPAVRCATGANTYYGFQVDPNNLNYVIFKVVAGTYTSLKTGACTAGSNGDVIRLEVSGTTLTGKRNGTVLDTVTDASIASGTPGVQEFGNGALNPDGINWAGADLSVGGGGGIVYSSNAALCIADYLNNASFGLVAQTKYPVTAAMLSQSGMISFNAANCVDGDVTTRGWHTDTSVPGAYVQVDLGSGGDQEFCRFRIYVEAVATARNYEVQRSDNGSTWTAAATGFIPDVVGWNEIELAPSGAHRYWRLLLQNTPGAGGYQNEIEFYTSDVDSTLLTAAANTCDEQVALLAGGFQNRFAIDGSFDTSESHANVIGRMNSAMGGSVLYVAGKWGIYPGIWRAPTISLADADCRGPLTVQTRLTHRDLYNGVKGMFVSPGNGWQIADYPPFQSLAYLAEDNNEPLWLDVELPFTISGAAAQRLSKIALRRARHQITVRGQFKLTAYQVQPLDIIQFSHPRFSWVNKTFEVADCTLVNVPDATGAPGLGVDLTLREADSTIYDWTTADELPITTITPPTLPSNLVTQPPSGLILSSAEIVRGADGIKHTAILASWTAPADQFVLFGGHIIVQYKKSSDSLWLTAAKADGSATQQLIPGVTDGIVYNVQIWSENTSGVKSAIVSGNITPTSTVSRNPSYTYYRPLSNPLTAHDAGSTDTINIAPFTMRVAGLDISLSSGAITALARNTLYFIYYDDPNLGGGYGVVASDSFARANGAPGSNWTAQEGAFSIASTNIYLSTGGGDNRATMYWNAASFANDQYAQLTITVKPTGSNRAIGPAVRCSTSAETYYGFYIDQTNAYLFKAVAGTITLIGSSVAHTPLVGDVLRIEALGTTITGFINGVSIISGTDASIASGSAGIIGTLVGSTDPQANNWSGGNITGITYNASTTKETSLNSVGRFFVGSIQTPRAGAFDTIGNNDGGAGAQHGMLNFLQMSLTANTVHTGTGTISNPVNVIDSDDTTFANINCTGNSTGSNAVTLTVSGPPGYSRRFASAILKIIYSVPTNNVVGTTLNTGFFFLSLDGGATWATILLTIARTGGTTAKTTLSYTLPVGQNLALVQVQFLEQLGINDTSGSIQINIYDAHIEGNE